MIFILEIASGIMAYAQRDEVITHPRLLKPKCDFPQTHISTEVISRDDDILRVRFNNVKSVPFAFASGISSFFSIRRPF